MGLAFVIALFFFAAVCLMGQTLYQTERELILPAEEKAAYSFGIVLLIFFAVRLLLAALTPGFPSDMSCWSAWGQRLSQLGTQLFYSPDYFCDYPPGYLYLLGLIARIAEILHLPLESLDFLNKLPAILCDMLLSLILYRTGQEISGQKGALCLSSLFLITPIFWFDSAVWGQVESVLLVFLVLSFLMLSQKRYLPATVFYVLAILIKPQGLILAPIFAISVLCSKQPKTILLCIFSGILLFLVCIIPFSPAWQEYTGGSAFLHALNPLWMIEKYLNTLASYPYFSVNAFNLYGLLQLNWVPLDAVNPLLISILNILILAVGVLVSLYLFVKIKHPASRLFLSAYFLFGFLFTFAFKMHERYIVLPLFFLLLDFLFTKNKKILGIFTGLSIAGFWNLYYVLQLNLTTNTAPDYRLVAPISFLEVALFLYSLLVIYKDYLASPKQAAENENTPVFPSLGDRLSGLFPRKMSKQTKSMTRLDTLLLTGIVLIYSLFAFINLGDSKAPQTYYRPKTENESFIITLQEPIMLTEINYYCGISDVDRNPGIQFSYSDDGELWTPLPNVSCIFDSVFHWETEYVDPIYVKYLQGTSQSTNYTLYEVGFRDGNGELSPIASITGENPALSQMADEQEFVTNQPSYQNSTYFDEIYHPRTAYEHLHGLPYYETTHPPLGKLMMAVGIAAFGMTPFGWRFAGALTGVLMLPIFYLFLKKLFRQTRYSVIGTLLFAFDFMHFSLTRLGTIDSYPVFFILGMYYFMYRYGEAAWDWAKGMNGSQKKELRYLFLSGLFMGLGCASKWTAVYASAGLAIEFFVLLYLAYRKLLPEEKHRFFPYLLKTCSWCLLFFVLIPAAIYTLSYLPISMVDGYGNVFEAMWNNQEYMLSYHSQLNGTHPYSSKWYTWPIVYKPMWAYQAPETSIAPDQIGCISIFQNPVLSWAGIAAFFYSLYLGWKKRDKRVLFLLIGLLAQYLPWVFVKRYALQYHFFATLPFLILFVVYAMEHLEKTFKSARAVSICFVILCMVLFLAFYPVLSGMPVSRFYAETILTWFDSWVFFL